MKTSHINSIIITVSLSTSFLISSVMFAEESTRRTADELVKINTNAAINEANIISDCMDSGGIPVYSKGEFYNCNNHK